MNYDWWNVLGVGCPLCRAAPNIECVTRWGTRRWPHYRRVQASG